MNLFDDHPRFRDEIAAAVKVVHFEAGFGVIPDVPPSPMFRVECVDVDQDIHDDPTIVYLVLPHDDAVRMFIAVCEKYLELRNDEAIRAEGL